MEGWLHRKVADDLPRLDAPVSTLEVGAGTLNQLDYEPVKGDYDIVEPFAKLFENSPNLSRVRSIYSDIREVPDVRYDRITSVAVFEHVMDLPRLVAECGVRLSDRGTLRCSIPNEGTVLWWLGTRFTGWEFKKLYGLDYDRLMQFEHVNTADEIEGVLGWAFERLKHSVCGVSRKLAFYRFYECSVPRRDVLAKFLEEQPPSA